MVIGIILGFIGIGATLVFGIIQIYSQKKEVKNKKRRKSIGSDIKIEQNQKTIIDNQNIILTKLSELTQKDFEVPSLSENIKNSLKKVIAIQKKGDFSQAIQLLNDIEQNITEEVSSLAYTFFLMGNNYFYCNDFHKAINEYDKAIAIKANFQQAVNNKGLSYYRLNIIAKAQEFYKKALILNSNFTDALNNLGVIYYTLNSEKKAFELFKKALDIDSNFIESINNIGILCYDKEKYEMAIQYFKKALYLKKDNSVALSNLKLARLKLNEKTKYAMDNKNPSENRNVTRSEKESKFISFFGCDLKRYSSRDIEYLNKVAIKINSKPIDLFLIEILDTFISTKYLTEHRYDIEKFLLSQIKETMSNNFFIMKMTSSLRFHFDNDCKYFYKNYLTAINRCVGFYHSQNTEIRIKIALNLNKIRSKIKEIFIKWFADFINFASISTKAIDQYKKMSSVVVNQRKKHDLLFNKKLVTILLETCDDIYSITNIISEIFPKLYEKIQERIP